MAIIAQKSLFGWKEIDFLGDLERLTLVLGSLPDEELMEKLEQERSSGRNDYPVRVMWNALIAGVIFQHPSIESLRRELLRNGQLRQLCGFDPLKGDQSIPNSWNFTRFLKKLFKHQAVFDAMFNQLVSNISQVLPDFGVSQAIDGKAIASHANGNNSDSKESDGRRDTDGDWAKKVYKGSRKDGSLWEKVVKWFGYRLHLIVDTKYELPIAYELTKASDSEVKVAHELIAKVDKNHPELLTRCDDFAGDRGYDDGKLVDKLWDDYGIKPVIDIRNCWKDGEKTKSVEGHTNVVYDYKGTVSCVCLKTGDQREMAFGGFEQDRMSLKYRCPAKQYGIECSGAKKCPVNNCIRIPLKEDRRIFTPLARSSYKWKKEYKKRTAVERVNGRIETVFGFDKHFIRGIKKMKMRVSLALCIMLALALGRIQQNHDELMRSLVKRAG